MQVARGSRNCRIERVAFADQDREMAGAPAAVETCPYCKKPFKRLKSHLPHCKIGKETSAVSTMEMSSPVTGNPATPVCLNTKKKERQIKCTEMAPKKENKKSKPELIRNEGKVKRNSLEPMDTAGSELLGNLLAPLQIKHSTEKLQKRENGTTAHTPGGDLAYTQVVEEVVLKTKLSKKSTRVQKTRSKNTSDKKKFASGIAQELLNPNDKSTLKSIGQPILKPSAKCSQDKEGSSESSVPGWEDPSMDDLQSIPQGVRDKVELAIENHCVRELRKRHDSSVQNIPLNEASTGSLKIGQQPEESLSATAEIPLTKEKQIIPGTENTERVLGLEIAGITWNVETGSAVTKVKAPDDHFLNSYQKPGNVPVQLAAGVKSMMGENRLSVISPTDSLVDHNLRSNPYPTFTETLPRKGNDEISNCYLTSLEKYIALDSCSEIPLKPPPVHTLETSAIQRLSSLKRGIQPGSLGLEWFPELYPNYHSFFSGKQTQCDSRIPESKVTVLPWKDRQVPLAERSLMDVKLQDLPAWLTAGNASPQAMLRATGRAWNGYYNRYINVKKGGVAGISMLLLGYCVLSYAWSYEHIKQFRWRKYH